ncbi:MAG: ribosome assembly factor SBDS [Hadesarchaea archaeon CG08_land_8_20_14_0_20_51_8]|jgi:ribosome maturation protein SDO1|nr:MAG: ribosome assembly factor SBDS [Hadesarchaea archaeon CG08_land_8_20_14_0_20_51_8]
MVKLEDAVVARLSSHSTTFEILVDPELAMAVKSGQSDDIRGVLALDKVFKDAKKGDKAADEMVQKVFGTTDVLKVAEEILRRGEIQVTTEQRRQMREQRLRQVIALLSKRAINPQTGTPHPPARIESAMETARVHVDEFKSAEEQLPSIIKALRPLVPLKFEIRRIAVKIPAAYTGKAQRVVKSFATVKQEQWLNDGSWAAVVEVPAGIQAEFFDKLNELTSGEAQTKVL